MYPVQERDSVGTGGNKREEAGKMCSGLFAATGGDNWLWSPVTGELAEF